MPQYQNAEKRLSSAVWHYDSMKSRWSYMLAAVHFAGDSQNGSEYWLLQLRILIYNPNFEFANSIKHPLWN